MSIDARHVIAVGPAFVDIRTLASGPRIVADVTRPGTFAVSDARRVDVFTTFADFTAKVAEKLSGGSKAVNLSATGDYDRASGDFSARRVLLELRAAN
jgi:hypothetical protein